MTAFYVSRRPETNISIKEVRLKKLTVAQLITGTLWNRKTHEEPADTAANPEARPT